MEYLFSVAALVVAIWTYLSTNENATHAERSANVAERDSTYAKLNAKAELFVTLRSSYLAIHKDFPRGNSSNYEDFELVYRAYWVNAYNEWFVTRKICPGYLLWEEFFCEAIQSSLSRSNLKHALDDMVSDGFAFGANDLRQEFFGDIGYLPEMPAE